MVSMDVESLVGSIKLSTVVPATVRGDHDQNKQDHDDHHHHELTNMDLIMKLHYIKGFYFFKSEAIQGLTIDQLKKPMFQWLDLYSTTSGRVRRSESTGRPFIKCNDCGVRIVEAKCDKVTIEELLEMKDHSILNCLAYQQVLGPDLCFSPLVFIQLTWFKCGGMSVGLSWAHVLGDAFSASTFINMWGQILAGHVPPKPLHVPNNPGKSKFPPSIPVKKVEPVGDRWITANNCKMDTYYFQVTADQLEHMVSNVSGLGQSPAKIPHFVLISSIIWKSLSGIREDLGPRIVTICRNHFHKRENEFPTNGMVWSIVEAGFSVATADISELAKLIADKRVGENNDLMIEEMMKKENGELGDFIAYGANLTFVDLLEAEIYGLEIMGQRPVFANYTINGVGDEGVVLVVPGPENDGGRVGLTVTVVLPENQLSQLKINLQRDWSIL